MNLSDKLIKVSNVFSDELKRSDYSLVIDEVIENVAINEEIGGDKNGISVEASAEADPKRKIKGIFWDMYEVSDLLEKKGLIDEARIIDSIRTKMAKEFNGVLKES